MSLSYIYIRVLPPNVLLPLALPSFPSPPRARREENKRRMKTTIHLPLPSRYITLFLYHQVPKKKISVQFTRHSTALAGIITLLPMIYKIKYPYSSLFLIDIYSSQTQPRFRYSTSSSLCQQQRRRANPFNHPFHAHFPAKPKD